MKNIALMLTLSVSGMLLPMNLPLYYLSTPRAWADEAVSTLPGDLHSMPAIPAAEATTSQRAAENVVENMNNVNSFINPPPAIPLPPGVTDALAPEEETAESEVVDPPAEEDVVIPPTEDLGDLDLGDPIDNTIPPAVDVVMDPNTGNVTIVPIPPPPVEPPTLPITVVLDPTTGVITILNFPPITPPVALPLPTTGIFNLPAPPPPVADGTIIQLNDPVAPLPPIIPPDTTIVEAPEPPAETEVDPIDMDPPAIPELPPIEDPIIPPPPPIE